MLSKEFIKELERLFTENFEKYTITKGEDYFIITKDDSEFRVIRNENCYDVYLKTFGVHYKIEISPCGLGNFIGVFQDCIFKDCFEKTIICLRYEWGYRQNRLRRKFKEIGKKYNMGGNKNVK